MTVYSFIPGDVKISCENYQKGWQREELNELKDLEILFDNDNVFGIVVWLRDGFNPLLELLVNEDGVLRSAARGLLFDSSRNKEMIKLLAKAQQYVEGFENV